MMKVNVRVTRANKYVCVCVCTREVRVEDFASLPARLGLEL